MVNNTWRFIDIENIDGYYSAALFESIAKHVGYGKVPETILFWRLKSRVIYLGYHQYVEDEIYTDFCNKNNIEIVRRILGGGCGFCDKNQILYSIIGRQGNIIPNDTQKAYKKVLNGVVLALKSLGIKAYIEPDRNAVYTKDKKISGNAQARFDNSVMVNGSFLIDFDFELMDKVLKNPTKNLKKVDKAKDGMITLKQMNITDIDYVKKALRNGFEKALEIKSKNTKLSESEVQMAKKLSEKYKERKWIYKMDIKRKLRKTSFEPRFQQF